VKRVNWPSLLSAEQAIKNSPSQSPAPAPAISTSSSTYNTRLLQYLHPLLSPTRQDKHTETVNPKIETVEPELPPPGTRTTSTVRVLRAWLKTRAA